MDKRSSWQIQKAVFHALFAREMQTRFGKYRLSYVWALIEPLSHIIVLSLLFSTIRERNSFFDVPFPLFFATGILSFFIFSKMVLSSLNAIPSNLGLYGYRQVKPLDTILVRCLLELLVILGAMFMLALIGGWIFDYPVVPVDPLGMVLILFLLSVLGFGIGLTVAVIGAVSEEVGKVVPNIIRPLYLLSGIIFPLQFVPEKYHTYLLWNPILHAVEQFRVASIEGYPASNTSLYFVFLSALFSLFFGLLFYRRNAQRVLTR
jgi:capsular polysaccharide transport system permease protein